MQPPRLPRPSRPPTSGPGRCPRRARCGSAPFCGRPPALLLRRRRFALPRAAVSPIGSAACAAFVRRGHRFSALGGSSGGVPPLKSAAAAHADASLLRRSAPLCAPLCAPPHHKRLHGVGVAHCKCLRRPLAGEAFGGNLRIARFARAARSARLLSYPTRVIGAEGARPASRFPSPLVETQLCAAQHQDCRHVHCIDPPCSHVLLLIVALV